MSERGSAMMDAAQDAASSIEETLEDVITQRPLATVGLALGLGFLIGVDLAPIGQRRWLRARSQYLASMAALARRRCFR